MSGAHLHFERTELDGRPSRTLAALSARGLDGLLMFRQESTYWLTGYDTFGYVYFQCVVLRADGRAALLTRAPDRLQAGFTSTIEDVRVWVDESEANPAGELAGLLRELGLAGKRLGVEWSGTRTG